MSANANAVMAKLARRGGSKAIARARRIVEQSPNGKLARRLGQNTGGATAQTIDRKEPLNAMGRQVRFAASAGMVSDARPVVNASQKILRARIPGSPF